jgi:dipeptidase E
MKKIRFLLIIVSIVIIGFVSNGQGKQATEAPVQTIFAYGGDFNEIFLKYVISLTNKVNPKICFMPTAGADNPYVINYWYELCLNLPIKPSVQRMFINSSPDQTSFEQNLLSVDAIVVGGGNTLNMIGIWKAQGIDTILLKAYKKGIVLAGGSAGSLCWFKCGISDSRPQKLSVVDCLGFINASHCPHFSSEADRKPLYESLILNKKIIPGYACDDLAGVLFQNGKFVKAVSINSENSVYYISLKDGKIDRVKYESEIIK